MVTMLAGKDCFASMTQSSGPMPAGSPEVTAMRMLLLLEPQLDVGFVAQLPQPLLVGLVGLALAQRLPGLLPHPLRRHFGGAPLEHLDEVVTERRLDRLADLARLQ